MLPADGGMRVTVKVKLCQYRQSLGIKKKEGLN